MDKSTHTPGVEPEESIYAGRPGAWVPLQEPDNKRERALWLADKIPAYGDYAKEAAELLRFFAQSAGVPSSPEHAEAVRLAEMFVAWSGDGTRTMSEDRRNVLKIAKALLSAQSAIEPNELLTVIGEAAQEAGLPEGYQWGRDAMEQFDFGKTRAYLAMRQAFVAYFERNGVPIVRAADSCGGPK